MAVEKERYGASIRSLRIEAEWWFHGRVTPAQYVAEIVAAAQAETDEVKANQAFNRAAYFQREYVVTGKKKLGWE